MYEIKYDTFTISSWPLLETRLFWAFVSIGKASLRREAQDLAAKAAQPVLRVAASRSDSWGL